MASLKYTTLDEVYISTALRDYDTYEGVVKGYETIVWEWDAEERKLGAMRYMDCTNFEDLAIKQHERLVKAFNYLYIRKGRRINGTNI